MFSSTKGRYALRVMADMAENGGETEFIPLAGIAQRQEISEKYLEAIVKLLVTNKLVHGQRGKGGGYMLSKKPSEYSIGEILKATEGDLAPVACLEEGAAKCPRAKTCKTVQMWRNLDNIITDYLEGVSLEDIMGEPSKKNCPKKKESKKKSSKNK